MARSRHGRSGGRSSPDDAGLPSWAQRHLEEAGDTAVIPAIPAPAARRRHRTAAAAAPVSGLRGWGVAIVSVAAAVGAVPLAVSSLANDHSDDPLPRVDTYTAGKPGPLQPETGPVGGTRSGPAAAPQGDQATGGVLDEPPAEAAAPVVPRRAAPVPAAVVRQTPAVVAPVVPRAVAPTTPTTTGPARSATPPKTKPPKSSPPPEDDGGGGGGRSGGGGGQQSGGGGGLIGNTVGDLTNTVGGVTSGLLGG